MMVAQNTQGPVFWVAPEWSTDRLHPEGVTPFFSPGRLTFVNPKRAEDILWCVEEILRSSAVPLVVADLPGLPALTPVRRLHLAAETGAREGGCAPLALLLTPGTGGAPGVESRWHMGPIPQTGMDHWQLTRIRSRSAPSRRWHVARHEGCYRLTPVAQGNLQS
jgi:protein ImuA